MSSTLEVLCGGDWCASGRTVLDESMPPRPDWIYPLTKLLAEELGHYHVAQNGLEVVQLRYAWVVNEANASRGLVLLARGVGDTDVAEANLLAATAPGLSDHVLLIGPDVPFKQADIQLAQTDPAAVVERHWPGAVAVLGERAKRLKSEHFWPVCRIDRAKQILGWRPKVTFERFLRGLGWRPAGELNATT
jgi:nucleoside-diphosphate-sugar epimerase